MASVAQNARETHNVHFGIMSLKGAANCDGLEGCLFIDTLLTPVAEKYCTRYSGVSLTRKPAKMRQRNTVDLIRFVVLQYK